MRDILSVPNEADPPVGPDPSWVPDMSRSRSYGNDRYDNSSSGVGLIPDLVLTGLDSQSSKLDSPTLYSVSSTTSGSDKKWLTERLDTAKPDGAKTSSGLRTMVNFMGGVNALPESLRNKHLPPVLPAPEPFFLKPDHDNSV